MNNNYYSTYKFYNERRKRLSAFAREINDEIEIVLWECNRKDTFTKRSAREMYEAYISTGMPCYTEKVKRKIPGKTLVDSIVKCAKPQIISIPKTKNLKMDFITYMEDRYLKAIRKYKFAGYAYLNREEREQYNDYMDGKVEELIEQIKGE